MPLAILVKSDIENHISISVDKFDIEFVKISYLQVFVINLRLKSNTFVMIYLTTTKRLSKSTTFFDELNLFPTIPKNPLAKKFFRRKFLFG